MTLQQGSQTQTPLAAKSSEAGIKTIGNDGSLELGMHACGKAFTFLLIFLYLKTKQIKRTLCQAKYICGPEPESLQSLKQSLSSHRTFRGVWSGYEITQNHAVCETIE